MEFREAIPLTSMISKESSEYDYSDSYFHLLKRKDVESWELIPAFFLSPPKWVDNLMVLRNKMASFLGLKTGVSEKSSLKPPYSKGQQIGAFQILDISEKEIILGETDKHLDFKVSLLIEDNDGLVVSTIVRLNNTLGKWYFVVVKPIHRIIVPIMIKRMVKNIDEKLLPQYENFRT